MMKKIRLLHMLFVPALFSPIILAISNDGKTPVMHFM